MSFLGRFRILPPGAHEQLDFAVTASVPVTLTGGGYGVEIVGTDPLVDEAVATTTDEVVVVESDGWIQIETANAPTVWGEYALGYDPTTQTTLLYGGNDDGWPYENETWRFTGTDWQLITTTQTPNAVYGANMTWLYGDKIVLFGGSTSDGQAVSETWRFDSYDWQQTTPTLSPPARTAAAAGTYGDQYWLFGGQNGTNYFDDFWVYNQLGNDEWQEESVSSELPPPRAYGALATSGGTALLFGGRAPDGTILDDFWQFGSIDNLWYPTHVNGDSRPPARMGHSLVYNEGSHQLILFGGYGADGNLLNDTWVFDFNTGTWIEDISAFAPPAGAHHKAVYDAGTGRVLIFIDGQTWIYK